jgi:hypothetical protein
MTDGLAATTLANKWLDMLAGTAFTAPASCYVQLHTTGGPGAAGTSNVFANVVTARSAVTWSAASAGSKSASNTPTWTANGAGGTVTDISFWDASTAGNFLFSAALSASKTVASGDVINLTSFSISFTPIAA